MTKRTKFKRSRSIVANHGSLSLSETQLNGFKKTGLNTYLQKSGANYLLVLLSIIILIVGIWIFSLFTDILNSVFSDEFHPALLLGLIVTFVATVFGLAIGFLFLIFGLVTSKSEIDIENRTITHTRPLVFRPHKKVIHTFSFDDLVINAVRFGATPTGGATSLGSRWMVKAGIKNDQTDMAFHSVELADEQSRNTHMLELFHLFFPHKSATESDIIQVDPNVVSLIGGDYPTAQTANSAAFRKES